MRTGRLVDLFAPGSAARRELVWLLLLLGLAVAVWGFVSIAGEVMEGDSRVVDRAILLGLRNPADLSDPLGPGWLEEMMRDFTALGGIGVLTVITGAIAGYLFLDGKPAAGWLLLAAVASGLLLSLGLKSVFDRPRPELVPHGSIVYTRSFPSGHSMLSALTYLTLGALLARQQDRRRLKAWVLAVATVLTVLTGVSRVYLGVHWPSDVLAGWVAGGAWALACWILARVLQRRGKVEAASPEEAAEDAATGSARARGAA